MYQFMLDDACGTMDGDVLLVHCGDDLTRDSLDCPPVIEALASVTGAHLGKTVSVRFIIGTPSDVVGGAVKAVCTGKKELQELVISPDALSPDDAEMLQDMIISAVNEALRQADTAMSKTMEGIGSGLNLGAFGL